MEEYWITAIVTALIIGLIPAYIAKGKGKDFFPWYIYGVSLFFFAMIHAIVLPEKKDTKQTLKYEVRDKKETLKDIPSINIYLDPLIVDLNCPIEVLSYSIKVTEDNEKAYLNIVLCNLSNKIVNAIKFKILCFDSFNEPVKTNANNILEKNIQDLVIHKGTYFGDRVLFELQNSPDTRKVRIIIKSVLFTDGTRWDYNREDLLKIETKLLKGEELDRLKKVAGEDAICYSRQEEDYWQCVCGRANLVEGSGCIRCGRLRESILYCAASEEDVNAELQRLKKQQEEDVNAELQRLKKQQEEEEEKRKMILMQTPPFQ